ncbi:MAG: DUF2203 domain-containing protein [Pyrinomonadaceae bacterium]|nr:DUF2203 domain-containing protein [Pyrinomonadaceae bacterium]
MNSNIKLFSVEEANALLPTVRLLVERVQRAHKSILPFGAAAREAAARAELGGGGMPGGASYVTAVMQLAARTSEVQALGVQIKDYARGLIDFPSLRDGRVVLLCWQLGEPEEIVWWHETDAGFAGRQPL